MAQFLIHGVDGPDGLARRPAVRPEHLAHLQPLVDAGRVRWAGPLLDPSGRQPLGSVIILEAATLEEAQAIAAQDPYALRGVFASVTVYPVKQVFPAA